MIRCVKCGQVNAIAKSGIIRGMQRYHCGACDYYFTTDSAKQVASKKSVKHHATIIDLAKQLNISKSTVSRALRGSSDISNQTKEAVLKLARKINYIPNHFAYSLAKKSSNTIGIIVPELISNFFPQFIIAAQEAATTAGYKVVICHSNESVVNEVEISKMLFANQVDGVLLSMSRETKDLNHLKIFQSSGIPVILYNRMIAKSRFIKVVADDYDGAFKGVEHLIKNGFKRIAHIAGPQALQISSNRLKGYKDALHKHGLPVDEKLIVQHDLSRSNARECALQLLAKQNPPDAVFAVNDPAAIEVMLVAKEKGIRIPDQLGIVGFSNDQRSEIMEPGLTTLEQPISQMAKTSIDLLLQQIEDPSSPVSLLTSFKTNLIIRGSSSRMPF